MGMEAQGQAPSERDDQNVFQDEESSETGHQSPGSAMLQDDEDEEVNMQETEEEEENLEKEPPENNLLGNTMEQIQVTSTKLFIRIQMNPLITINPIEAGVQQHMISVFKSAVCICRIPN